MHATVLSFNDIMTRAVICLRQAMYNLNNNHTVLFFCTLAAIAIAIAYLVFLSRLKSRGVRPLLLPGLIIWFLGTVHFMFGTFSPGHTNLLALFVESASDSFDMFIASNQMWHTRGGDLPLGTLADPQNTSLYVLIFTTIYTLAIMTSIFFVIRVVLRRISRRHWLIRHAKEAKKGGASIYFGAFPEALQMAAASKEKALVISYFEREPNMFNLRVGMMHLMDIMQVRPRPWNQELLPEGSNGTVLHANTGLANTDLNGNPLEQMGLSGLEKWLECPENKVYLLSDDTEENLRGIRVLRSIGTQARIFARVPRKGRFNHLELSLPANYNFVDEASLALHQVMSTPEWHPVHYVKIAEKDGQRLGYVESEFRCLIIGFGDIGERVLPFLYTFGAFVDAKQQRSPFHCTIIDPAASDKEGLFWQRHPGLSPASGIEFLSCLPGSVEFLDWLKQEADRLNYVVVATGSDSDNLTISVDILEYIHRFRTKDMERLIILYHNSGDSQASLETDAFYKKNYSRWLCSFGNVDTLWKEENLSEKEKETAVRTFHRNYALASGTTTGADPWDQMLEARKTGDLPGIRSSRRKIQQNYDNYYHIATKCELAKGPVLDNRNVALGIPSVFEGQFCAFDGPVPPHSEQVLENLAVTEHLRWQSTLEMMGYNLGAKTDDELMTHNCICPYDQLSGQIKHYDWLVVKSALLRGKH